MRVAGIRFAYPGHPVFDGVSLDVPEGRLVGVLGPNGSGKSTLLRCMHAALTPSRGSVLVDGTEIAALARRDVARRIAVVPQSCSPGFQISVGEFVGMGRYARESFLGGQSRGDREAVTRALADAGLAGWEDRSVHELSGGEFRRVLIAQALAQETPVLLLDEPVQQLDLLHQIEVMDLVRGIARRPGAAAVAVLHDLNLAARWCDLVVLLAGGRVVAAGSPDEVVTETNLRNAFGVEAAVDRCPETGAVRVTALRPASLAAVERSAT